MICSVAECSRPITSRGWCQTHYTRWLVHGDPSITHLPYYTEEEDATVCRMYSEGASLEAIGQSIGRTTISVGNRLKKLRKAGLTSRTPYPRGRGRVLASYRADAKKHGRDWALSDQEFDDLTQRPCVYCGALPSNRCEDFTYSGLDRIDNNHDYVSANVAPCCSVCNYAKRNMSRDEFLTWVQRVFNHSCQ